MRFYPILVLLVSILGGEFNFLCCHAAGSGDGIHLDRKGPIIEARSVTGLELTREVTLEAWVLPGKYTEAGVRLIDKSEAGTQSGYMMDTFPGNSLRLVLAEVLLTARDVLEPERWTHVAGVFIAPRGIYKLYVNGKEVASLDSVRSALTAQGGCKQALVMVSRQGADLFVALPSKRS